MSIASKSIINNLQEKLITVDQARMNPPSDLQGKVALITGASTGIGRGCAVVLAAEGCCLALNGRNKAALEETKKLCTEKGVPEDKVLIVEADVTKDDDCKRMVSSTVEHFKQLDILINNAGVGVIAMTEELSMDDYDLIMNTNLRAVFQLTKLCLPHLAKTKGNIINISSMSSQRQFPGLSVYSCTKAGLDHFTKMMAMEAGGKGIRVNAINPGIIVTDIFQKLGVKDAEKFYETEAKLHPIGRIGYPEDIGQAAAFLASSKAAYITGVTLLVDGGRSLAVPLLGESRN